MSSNNMYNILNTLKSLEPTPEQTVKAEAKRIYESVEAQGSITAGVGAVEARLREKFAEGVAEGHADQQHKVFKKNGKPVGEVGIDPEASPGNGNWYVKHYASGYDVVGFDSYEEAVAELKHCMEQGVAEDAKPDFLDLDHDGNEKETMKQAAKDRDGVRVHKGTYGTEYDPSDEEKKDKPKHVPRKGETGARTKAERQAAGDAAPDLDTSHLGSNPFSQKVVKQPKVWKGPSREISGARSDDTTNADDTGDTPEQRAKKLKAKFKKTGKIGEVITKKTSAGDIIHDFQKSKNPKFSGKSKEQRKNQALGAYYGMHPEKSNKKESMRESKDYKKQNFLFESFNFANMMKEADQTVQEMLEELQKDIGHYKMTGECSPKLDAFLRVHGHNKKQLADEAKAVPNYEVPAVHRKVAGEPALSLGDVQAHDANRSMHPGMTRLDAPKPAHHHIHDELDELAQLAGITDEGNAFTGKLAKTAHGDSFELDGNTYKDTSKLDEAMCNECGMYESQCSCTEGNLFTKKLAQTPKGGEFELDGKQYKDTSNLDQTSMKLEDIAKLAGIAVEGKDYGDTSFNPAPTYDNTPEEVVYGEDVLLKGGDGEVAGAEKVMRKSGYKHGDNPLAMKESETKTTDLMKEAATFDPIEAMGRRLMKQYESIKLQK